MSSENLQIQSLGVLKLDFEKRILKTRTIFSRQIIIAKPENSISVELLVGNRGNCSIIITQFISL